MQFKLLLKRIRPGKRVLFGIVTVIFIALAFLGFIFLRHRQICSYQQAVTSGLLSSETNQSICPSILNPDNWTLIVNNAFNLQLTNSLSQGAVSLFQLKASAAENCSDQLNPLCWFGDSKPSLRQTDGFTNVLLVGLDTRGSKGLKNTDTLVLASLDHASGKVLLLSFPRDLYVKYRNPKGANVAYKINGIYALSGIEGLNSAISQIVGKPIHYYAYINLTVFSEAITALGGVNVNLDKPFSDLFPCVELAQKRQGCIGRNSGFGRFQFPAGMNHFDAVDANVYARSRYASSDFDRARRQQNVISSILKEALNQTKPLSERLNSYINLYNIFRAEVLTDVQLQDVAGLFAIADQLNDNPLRVTLDPSLDGGKIVKNSGIIPGAGYSIEFRDGSYRQFQNYISSIWNNLAFYSEHPKILIVNASGEPLPADSIGAKLMASPPAYSELKYVETSEHSLEGMRIYGFTDKSASLNKLVSLVPESLVFSAELDKVTQSDYKEDLLLVIGRQTLIDEDLVQ